MLRVNVNASTLQLDGRPALWLSAQPCLPQQVEGESHQQQHVESIVQSTGGQVGVPLVAWLSPEPGNPQDSNAVMVWVRGGKVGYLPRADAEHWQQIIFGLQRQAQLPVACGAHVELPPEGGAGTSYQVVLWLPPLSWQTGTALSAQAMAMFMAQAQHEPFARADRLAVKNEHVRVADEQRKANHANRLARLTARHGPEVAARIVAQELWLGATEEMVIEAFGNPANVEEKVMKTKTKRTLGYAGECARCDGTGFIAEFALIDDGKCFGCNGTGHRKGFVLRVRIEKHGVVGWDKK